MKSLHLVVPASLTLILALSTGCGGNGFTGDSGKNATSGETAGSSAAPGPGQAHGSDNLDLGPPANATPEQAAIGKCLVAWGSSNPFKSDVYDSFREVYAAVSVLGGGGYAVQDTEVTDGPKLVLVHAAVSVLGQANYLLMNPNGWYCIMADVNVMSNSEVDLQCKAHLADSKVQVNVGSTADNTGSVGVNVFSNVKVIRKPAANSTSGC